MELLKAYLRSEQLLPEIGLNDWKVVPCDAGPYWTNGIARFGLQDTLKRGAEHQDDSPISAIKAKVKAQKVPVSMSARMFSLTSAASAIPHLGSASTAQGKEELKKPLGWRTESSPQPPPTLQTHGPCCPCSSVLRVPAVFTAVQAPSTVSSCGQRCNSIWQPYIIIPHHVYFAQLTLVM